MKKIICATPLTVGFLLGAMVVVGVCGWLIVQFFEFIDDTAGVVGVVAVGAVLFYPIIYVCWLVANEVCDAYNKPPTDTSTITPDIPDTMFLIFEKGLFTGAYKNGSLAAKAGQLREDAGHGPVEVIAYERQHS